MKKVLSVLCLLAIALGMIVVPAVTAEAATETFYAGYGIANITPAYTVRTLKASSNATFAGIGLNDAGTVRVKTINDPLVYSSYGTSDLRMGQSYVSGNSYDADGKRVGSAKHFTAVNGEVPKYQIVDGDLFATCIALRYGNQEPLLLVALDMSGVTVDVTRNIREAIYKKVKEVKGLELKPERIMVSASHTHSSPSATNETAANKAWCENVYYPGIAQAALDSLNDLAAATIKTATVCASRADEVGGEYLIYKKDGNNINSNSTTSYANFNYDKALKNYDPRLQYMSSVRHYKYQTYACTTCGQSYVRTDTTNKFSYNYTAGFSKTEGAACPDKTCGGKVTLVTRYYGDSFWTRAEGVCAPTSMQVNVKQAYQDMHLVCFDRATKKDIVLMNWRAHPHRVGSETSSVMSNDLSGAIRDVLSGVRSDDGTYTATQKDHSGIAANTGEMDYLVSYYQGAAGNINESSHDRSSGSNGNTGNTLNTDKTSYYYDWENNRMSDYYTDTYMQQGAILADIARNALNTGKWWTTKTAGPINVISTTYGSDATNLNIQVAHMIKLLDEGHISWDRIKNTIDKLNGYPLSNGTVLSEDPRLSMFEGANGYKALYAANKEHAVYKYLYDTVVVMRDLFQKRNDSKYYEDVQACRRAVIERDPAHVINGLYNANKTYGLLESYDVNGVFTEKSTENYKKSINVLTEEIDTILIGKQLGIVTAPHELFDYTAQQIENLGAQLGAEDLKILNFCYSNGSNGYIPYDEAWEYTSTIAEASDPNSEYYIEGYEYYFSASPYEANTCSYERGAAEGIRDTALAMLADLLDLEGQANHCACFNNPSVSGNTGYYHNTDHVCSTAAWTGISGTKETLELTNGDKYQLTGNTTVTTLTLAAATKEMPAVNTMICLNGHTLTLGGGVVLAEGQTLAICGCEKSQQGKIVNASGNTTHFFTIREGELLIFGGTLDANKTHRAILFGSSAKTPGKLCMFGGTILNGKTTMPHASGNVTMNSGQFWLYGGTITGGQSLIKPAGSNYNYNDPSMAGTIHGAGGNVYINGGVFRQHGSGTISNGKADLSGGNVFIQTGKYVMDGGIITGGLAEQTTFGYASVKQVVGTGGNVFISSDSEFIIRKGEISNGVATYGGGNVYSKGSFTANTNVDFYGNDCSGVITGGYASGDKMQIAKDASGNDLTDATLISKMPRGARGGNICSAGTLWLYGGTVSNGRAGIMEDGTENPNGQRPYYCGGNIYATSAARIAGEVRDGAAYGRGNNLYFDANAVCNLEGAKFYDHSALAKAAENVNVHNARTVKLVGDCQFIGGDIALRLRNVPATLPDPVASVTPETGVWLDASYDAITDELLGAPAFRGERADIVLVPVQQDGQTVNTYLCLYDNFQRVASNYYYKDGNGLDEQPVNEDNRISVEIESDTTEGYQFARKGISYTEKTTDDQGNQLTTPEYTFKVSKVQLGIMRYCFKGVDEDHAVSFYRADPQITTPQNEEQTRGQWLILTAYTADVNGTHYSFQKAVEAFAKGNGDKITLLCPVDATGEPVQYTGDRTLVIDLAGYDLTADFSMTKGAKLACIDSTTNDYNCYWEGDVGQKYGTLYTNSTDVLEPQILSGNRRYLRIGEDAKGTIPGYSFHRIYMQMTGFGITPGKSGITYTAVFLANARVRNILGTNGYGVNVSLSYNGQEYNAEEGGSLRTYNVHLPSPSVGQDKGTYTSQDLNDYAKKTTLIEGILEPNKNWTTDERANIQIHLTPCVEIDGAKLMVGTEVTRTYKEQIGKVNAAWTEGTLTDSQKDGLYSMYRKYMDTLQNWEDQFVSNMRDRFFDESSVDKELDNELDGDPWA